MSRASLCAVADSTSSARDLFPYWNGSIAGINYVLWLPTETDWRGSGLNSSDGWLSKNGGELVVLDRTEHSPLYGWPHLFSQPIQNFAVTVAGMKGQREDADYNPDASFIQIKVNTWIDRAEQAIIDFNNASPHARG